MDKRSLTERRELPLLSDGLCGIAPMLERVSRAPTRQFVRRQRIGRIFHGLALLTALAALFLFLIGMYEVKEAIKHLNY